MPMMDTAPPPVFAPSTQGPADSPMPASPVLGQMAGMMPTPGQSPTAMLRAAGDILLRAAQQAQASGDTSLAPVVAQALSLLTDWSGQALQQPWASGQAGAQGGLPQMQSPLQTPPMLPRNGMPPPGMGQGM